MPSKYKSSPRSSLVSQMLSNIITLMFLPAYASFVVSKTCIKLPFVPAIWMIKLINPNIADDVT